MVSSNSILAQPADSGRHVKLRLSTPLLFEVGTISSDTVLAFRCAVTNLDTMPFCLDFNLNWRFSEFRPPVHVKPIQPGATDTLKFFLKVDREGFFRKEWPFVVSVVSHSRKDCGYDNRQTIVFVTTGTAVLRR